MKGQARSTRLCQLPARAFGSLTGVLVGCLLLAACTAAPMEVTPEWALGEAVFEVGGLSDDERYILGAVVGGLRLDDGRVVIADELAHGLKLYRPDGQFVKQVGSEGQGPGEFEYLRGVGRCQAGRIAAYQIGWSQNLYDLNLDFVGTRPADFNAIGGRPYEMACNQAGYVLATGWGDFRGQFQAGFYVATAPVALLRHGELIHDFGERLSSERVGSLRANGEPGGSGPHPFGRSMSVALGPDRAYLGDAADYLVEVYDLEGNRLPDLTWDGPALSLPSSDFDALVERMVAQAAPADQPAVRRRWGDLPVLERYPAYDTMMTDVEGHLWVRLFPRVDAEVAHWVVFDGEGGQIGGLSLPLRATLLDAGPDWVLVSELGELDVATVRVYEILR